MRNSEAIKNIHAYKKAGYVFNERAFIDSMSYMEKDAKDYCCDGCGREISLARIYNGKNSKDIINLCCNCDDEFKEIIVI